MGGISIEPFVFLGCVLSFLIPILMKKMLEYAQVIVGIVLFMSLMIFHEELQIRILFVLALMWILGSISALQINQKRRNSEPNHRDDLEYRN